MRRYLLFLVIAILPLSLIAQNEAFVIGKVYDAITMELLPAVHVLSENGTGTISDRDGHFFLAMPPGRAGISFRFIGYKEAIRILDLSAGDTIVLEIGLDPDITPINEIVVSDGRREQRKSELTVSMNVIKPYYIQENHITGAEELLNKIQGIEVMDGQASFRGGSGYSYGAGSRVMALVNGMPVLAADAGNIKWSTLPLDNLSRIEVIKGASSVLYGSSALNGVINFITAEPGPVPVTRFSASTGIYDKPANRKWLWWSSPRMVENISFSHSGKYNNTGIVIGARLLNDNGYRYLNDETSGQFNIDVIHGSKNKESLTYGISINTTLTRKIDFLLWEEADSGALKQNELTAMDFKGATIGLSPFITVNKNDRIKHEVKLKSLSNFNTLPGNANNNSNSHMLMSEYQFSYLGAGMFKLISGLSQQLNIINSNFHGDHNGVNIAGYFQGEVRPMERLKIIAGVRLEQNILDGVPYRLVPILRSGINWEASGNTFLRASFGQGFRYPSVAEKFAYTTVGSVKIFPNDEIKPESGWSSEAGVKHLFSKGDMSGEADAAIFYSQNSDMIEYVFGSYYDPVTDEYGIMGFKPVNIENSRVYGIETEVIINRSFGMVNASLRGGYTYMYPVEFNGTTLKNTGEYLKYRRKHSAMIALRTLYRGADISFDLYYKSKLLAIDDVFTGPDSETILPGFTEYWSDDNNAYIVSDISLGYRINQVFKVSAAVKNLTNTEYLGRPGDIMPQRFYSLQFGARF